MAITIDDAIASVRNIVAGITGIRAAPDGIPENDGGIYPFFVAWNGGGTLAPIDSTWEKGLWNITCQVHFSRRSLYQAEASASPWARKIARRLCKDTTLGGTATTFSRVEISKLGPMRWVDTDTIGYELTIRDVKVNEARET